MGSRGELVAEVLVGGACLEVWVHARAELSDAGEWSGQGYGSDRGLTAR